MNLKKIISKLEIDTDEKDSPEYIEQSKKCQELYDELSKSLDEEQKKKLCKLDFLYFMRGGQWKDDGFADGAEKGFKLAVRLLIDSMRD